MSLIVQYSLFDRFVWVDSMSDHDLEMMLDIVWQWRNYFGVGPGADTETQAWCGEFHRYLARKKEQRRKARSKVQRRSRALNASS